MHNAWNDLPFEQRITYTYEDNEKYFRIRGRMMQDIEARPGETSYTFDLETGTPASAAELARREVEEHYGVQIIVRIPKG